MNVISEADIIKDVARRLYGAEIRYMLTGSIAANFYTVPRMTRDIDIVIELEETAVDTVIRLFEKDYLIEKSLVAAAIRTKQMFNIIHFQSVIKIDFIVRKENPYRREEFSRRKQITFEDAKLYITAPEDLILSKLYWVKETMSELQLGDVRNLLKSVHGLDKDYLKKWANYLGVEDIYEKAMA